MFSLNAFSQEVKEKKWILKLNTTQLIDAFSFPTIQLSAEKKLNPYLGVNAEFGYQLYEFKFNPNLDTISLKPKGFKANLELRFYFQKLNKSLNIANRSQLYIGAQIFYRQNQKSSSVEYRRNENDSIYYDDNFGVKKSAKGINLTFGNQISISENIIFEPYLVVGYMDRKIENFDLEYNKEKHVGDKNDGIPILIGYDIDDKSKQNINFGFGLRVGYRF